MAVLETIGGLVILAVVVFAAIWFIRPEHFKLSVSAMRGLFTFIIEVEQPEVRQLRKRSAGGARRLKQVRPQTRG